MICAHYLEKLKRATRHAKIYSKEQRYFRKNLGCTALCIVKMQKDFRSKIFFERSKEFLQKSGQLSTMHGKKTQTDWSTQFNDPLIL